MEWTTGWSRYVWNYESDPNNSFGVLWAGKQKNEQMDPGTIIKEESHAESVLVYNNFYEF